MHAEVQIIDTGNSQTGSTTTNNVIMDAQRELCSGTLMTKDPSVAVSTTNSTLPVTPMTLKFFSAADGARNNAMPASTSVSHSTCDTYTSHTHIAANE